MRWCGRMHALRLAHAYLRARPAKVVSTGGLSAVPVFCFAWLLGIKRELFELNAVPGSAVKLLAPLSNTIFYCYKSAARYLPEKKIQYKPYPIRSLQGVTAYEARTLLGLNPHKKTLCFLGGSQGSHFINEFAQKLVKQYKPHELQIIHQAGKAEEAVLTHWYHQQGYTAYVVYYYHTIELLYSASDFVVCRAGAGTLWELEYMQIKTCVVPLEINSTDHQLHNAQALCAEKPEQFLLVRQREAEQLPQRVLAQIMSFWAPESQSPADHEDLQDDPLFHQ